jgi:uncharacterized protein YndB with AHSA1/START domain
MEIAMPDVLLDLPIRAPIDRVFQAVSTPRGLDCWWTKQSAGSPAEETEFELGFGPEYNWRARVTRCVPNSEFELRMILADDDWTGTFVGFQLEDRNGTTWVKFHHTGWPSANEHFRISSNCWAMYLRILRRYLEHGEQVPYEDRLDV